MTTTAVQTERNDSLLKWFSANGRRLPWRMGTDPYPVLVSEVMLQQTQVSRVIPRFEAFMERWTRIDELSKAPTDDLLAMWSGLGYNTRAIRLRETARIVTKEGWPSTIEGLTALPGVGPYTAAAVGSISFGLEAPALDTNLRRVLSRWAGESLAGQELETFAIEAVGRPAGDWNQALMDLGSAMCTPKNPKCNMCPVSEWCSDPTIYDPPSGQSLFKGSHRQLRGVLLRAHLGAEDPYDAGRALGRTSTEIQAALDSLHSEGLLPAHSPPRRSSDMDL